MLRVTSVVFSIISLLLITAIVNGAGNTAPKHEPLIIEISTIRSNGVPTSQPVEGKPQSTVKVLADRNGTYLTEVKLGDRVVHLSGKIKAAVDDKMLRVDVDYSDTAPGNAQSIKSLIMTPIDQPKTIAGMNRGDLTFAVVLTLHEYKPTNE